MGIYVKACSCRLMYAKTRRYDENPNSRTDNKFFSLHYLLTDRILIDSLSIANKKGSESSSKSFLVAQVHQHWNLICNEILQWKQIMGVLSLGERIPALH